MKRMLPLALSVFLCAAPVMAGDVNMPGKPEPPPPCTSDCPTATTTTPAEPESVELALTTELLLWVLTLVSP
jgi:hypothetical protein